MSSLRPEMVFGTGVSSKYAAIVEGFSHEYDLQYGKPEKDDEVALTRKSNIVNSFCQEVKYLPMEEFNEYYELYSTTYKLPQPRRRRRITE